MSEPFIGQIIMFGGNFAPRGWAFCEGQLVPINSNQALFSILGTTYGGDGRITFGLPDLRGRSPMHQGQGPGLSNRPLGTKIGTANETLNMGQLPAHIHGFKVSVNTNAGDENNPNGQFLSSQASGYHEEGTAGATLGGVSESNFGGGQSHENRQPFLAVAFIIALQGLFPSRN